ncbi:MAG: S9 family peptidase [Phycisphaerales bacterium]|nr:S9 family peptidase [Phycisphaerales bacterium]
MRQLTAAALLCAASCQIALAAPPPTERRPVTETLHGVEITDDYQWLEGDNSDPRRMGRLTPEVAEWTDRQNEYTRGVLDGLPGREALESRLRELMSVGSVSAPTMRGNRYFYSMREGDQQQSVVYMREGHDGEPVQLLDPVEIDPTGLTTVSWTSPSPDGSLLAFGMYTSGDENSTLYIMEVDTGRWLAEEIPGKVSLSGWMPDGRSFFYRRLEDLDDPYSAEFRYHKIGTHHRHDPVLFRQRDVAETFYAGHGLSEDRLAYLARTWGPFAAPSEDGRWLAVGYWTGTSGVDLWIADLDHWFRTGELELVEAAIGKDGRVGGFEFVGDTLYLSTNQESPNGRVVAVDLHNPAFEHWRDVVPEREDTVLRGFSVARGRIVANYLEHASTRLRMFSLDGREMGDVELPGIGSAGISTKNDRSEAFLSYSSFDTPPSIYRVDLASGERSLWERPEIPVDPTTVEVKQVFYESRDGTRVPMFLVHKRGLELDGTNPTILGGYGGFNIPRTPSFGSTMFPWYENGGVYAVACIRGGGEYGADWHRAGMLENKQNVFDDFIAAAEWLIDNKYTSPANLGIVGGSNGGLLTGAVVAQRPELFSAAISAVPLLDMLRYQDFLMARYWVPEYGTAEDPSHFQWLYAYSPYHNIEKGVEYPAMLITAGENDMRVHPMHARKMAALMQHATASDPADKPVLLWVEREAGHGGGKPLEMRIRDVADARIFMMWQLGMLD